MDNNLKEILSLMDKSVKVYDWLRLKGHEGPVDEAWEIYEKLFFMFLESYNKSQNYQFVHALEDCIIHPGETKEVKTDISELTAGKSIEDNKYFEFTNKGIISTLGYLSFNLEKNYENGNRMFVTNNVPKKIEEDYDLCGYYYCDPTSTQYFPPGIYRIEEGTVIGIAGSLGKIEPSLQTSDRVNRDINKIATPKHLSKKRRK